MAAPTHRVDGRSSAASFTSATANATAGSTTLYACVGEVRAPNDPNQDSPELVIDVAELIWEPIAE